ncbi:MAG: hypothetical protein K0S76_2685 [Herbinix sp.]|nr:hypothetical protein [Herbinix sp.]
MGNPFDCISDFIFVETKLKKSDVILIPGASQPQLMERAAELYLSGLAPYILPSGGPNSKLSDFETEGAYLISIGIKLGVPEEAILKEDKAQNTFENAQFSYDLLRSLNIEVKNIILVCKAYHSRRALLTYQSFFPKDINFYVAPVIDRRGISKDNWYMKEESIKLVMGEIVKIGKYFDNKIWQWV